MNASSVEAAPSVRPSSQKTGWTMSGAASRCSQKATSERRVCRRRSDASHHMAKRKVHEAEHQGGDLEDQMEHCPSAASVSRSMSRTIGVATRPMTRATTAAAPAATVIGTLKRRQCAQAAPAVIAALAESTRKASRGLSEIVLADREHDRGADAGEDAGEEGERRMMLGSAMRRLRREEFGEAPGGRGDEQAEEGRGAVAVDLRRRHTGRSRRPRRAGSARRCRRRCR